jgi:hypothetical protein
LVNSKLTLCHAQSWGGQLLGIVHIALTSISSTDLVFWSFEFFYPPVTFSSASSSAQFLFQFCLFGPRFGELALLQSLTRALIELPYQRPNWLLSYSYHGFQVKNFRVFRNHQQHGNYILVAFISPKGSKPYIPVIQSRTTSISNYLQIWSNQSLVLISLEAPVSMRYQPVLTAAAVLADVALGAPNRTEESGSLIKITRYENGTTFNDTR